MADHDIDVQRLARVLFIDDEEETRDGLALLLRGYRSVWDMHFVSSVDEGLEKLRRGGFDVVVSDYLMPEKTGFDLLDAMRQDEQLGRIPTIVLIRGGDGQVKRRALELGATDLLNLPVDPDELIARIHSAVRLKLTQDALHEQNALLEDRVRARTAELEFARVELVWRLGRAGEFRDSDTGYHIVRVGYFARELAEGLGLDAATCNKLFLTAPLHDIGKIGIPDSILLKPGPLTPEEWDVMRQHTTIGAQIFREDYVARKQIAALGVQMVEGVNVFANNPFTETAAEIAESHHECWDGTGYPNGIAGDDIPLAARITTVADVYDALSSVRPYKKAFEPAEVLDIIRRGNGTRFDPDVISVFETSLARLRAIQEEFRDEGTDVQADVQSAVDELSKAG